MSQSETHTTLPEGSKSSVTEVASDVHSDELVENASPPPKLWARFFAKSIDLICFTFVAAFLFGFIGILTAPAETQMLLDHPIFGWGFAVIALLLFALILEPILISKFGTTFGKWLLSIRLRDKDTDEKISLSKSFGRSRQSLVFGLGLGIPLISLMAMVMSYTQVQSSGEADWDRERNVDYQYGKVGFKWIIALAIFVSDKAGAIFVMFEKLSVG